MAVVLAVLWTLAASPASSDSTVPPQLYDKLNQIDAQLAAGIKESEHALNGLGSGKAVDYGVFKKLHEAALEAAVALRVVQDKFPSVYGHSYLDTYFEFFGIDLRLIKAAEQDGHNQKDALQSYAGASAKAKSLVKNFQGGAVAPGITSGLEGLERDLKAAERDIREHGSSFKPGTASGQRKLNQDRDEIAKAKFGVLKLFPPVFGQFPFERIFGELECVELGANAVHELAGPYVNRPGLLPRFAPGPKNALRRSVAELSAASKCKDRLKKELFPNGQPTTTTPAGCSGTGKTASQTVTEPSDIFQPNDYDFATTIPASCNILDLDHNAQKSVYIIDDQTNTIISCNQPPYLPSPPGRSCPNSAYEGPFPPDPSTTVFPNPPTVPQGANVWHYTVELRKADIPGAQASIHLEYSWQGPQ
jgi:hypothetical protein